MEGTRDSSGHATEMPFLFGFRSAALPLPAGQHPSASHRHPVRNAHQSLSFGLKHKATEDGHVCAPECRQVSRCPKEEAGPKDVLVPSCLCPHPLSSSGLGHASPHSYSPPTEIFLSLKSHFKSPLQATPFLPTSKSLHPCSRPPPPCPLQSPHFRSLLPDHVEVPAPGHPLPVQHD